MNITIFAGAQGGAGTSVNAASFAVSLSATERVLLVDLSGDAACPAVLGMASSGMTLDRWFGSGMSDQYLRANVCVVKNNLSVVCGGRDVDRSDLLAALVESAPLICDRLVVDWGRCDGKDAAYLATVQARRILCSRACYLGARAASRIAGSFDVLAVLADAGRALGTKDMNGASGLPVVWNDYDPSVARSVDAGLLGSRPSKFGAQFAQG